MNVLETLNRQLLDQSFESESDANAILSKYQRIASTYSEIENAIAVLSDLKSNKSYFYYGGIAEQLGLHENGNPSEINSIWEDHIFDRIHSEDLVKKYALELRFLHFLNDHPPLARPNYYTTIPLRIRDGSGRFVTVQHKMLYAIETEKIRLALCLYSFFGYESASSGLDGAIVNSLTGESVAISNHRYKKILSRREKEILGLIVRGKKSRQIAAELHISLYTVNRHRQNILQKLSVRNSIEAYKVAELMGLL